MYQRMYGKYSNYFKQRSLKHKELTLIDEFSLEGMGLKSRYPRKYGPPKKRPNYFEREVLKLEAEGKLDESSKKELEEARENKRFMDEKNRVDEETLEKLKQEILLVLFINEHIEPNSEEHNTDLFECTERDEDPQLVVRRGQEFKITITFQRPFDKDNDDVYLVFTIGDEPNPHKKTCAKCKLQEDDTVNYMLGAKSTWGARILAQSENDLTIAVYSPPYAIVGEWEYNITTVKQDTKEEFCKEGDTDFVVLFNPWCKDDQTYMDEKADLDEYVLNPFGTVFCGSRRHIKSRPWYYAQFQNGILDICLKLLRHAMSMSISLKMGDPVHVSRALTRILNNCDDMGVLSGRWDGKYTDGVQPTAWQGSAAILKKYDDTGDPVKYGQCWVFSHLLTTISRALGLPCRSVTNFASAHDTDATMTIDNYLNGEGYSVEYKNRDSIWNFHVWNEVWMHRPDLDKAFNVTGKYDGWHVVDATPQEKSEMKYQCGPSPLSAIKLGEVHVGYDTEFIFAEVNAECCEWLDGSPPILMYRNTYKVGKKISTKYPDGAGYKEYCNVENGDVGVRLDLTNCYKAKEGTAAEREAVQRATDQGKFADLLFENTTGVNLSVVEGPNHEVGENFVVTVQVENTSDQVRTVRLRTSVTPATYCGIIIGQENIAYKQYSLDEVKPNEVKTYALTVEAEQYLQLCDDALNMRILCLCFVMGFEEAVFTSDDVQINVPKIAIEGLSKVTAGEVINVNFKVTNPLKKPMTNCQLSIDGSVFVENEDFKLENDAVYKKEICNLSSGETQHFTVQIKASPKPKKSKVRELNVAFASDELPDFEGNFSMQL